PVRSCFIGAEYAERVRVHLDNIANELPLHTGGFGHNGTWSWHSDGVVVKIRQAEITKQEPPVGVWIGAHAALSCGREFGEFSAQAAAFFKELPWFVALHPIFQDFDVRR